MRIKVIVFDLTRLEIQFHNIIFIFFSIYKQKQKNQNTVVSLGCAKHFISMERYLTISMATFVKLTFENFATP